MLVEEKLIQISLKRSQSPLQIPKNVAICGDLILGLCVVVFSCKICKKNINNKYAAIRCDICQF